MKEQKILRKVFLHTVKEYIKEVCDAKLINIEEINEDLLKDIKKYKLLIA